MSCEHGPLFREWIIYNKYRKIVEVGVARGGCTEFLCQAANVTNGTVYGFDCWSQHGLMQQFKRVGSKEEVEAMLTNKGFKNFFLTQVDTTTSGFEESIKAIGVLDFVFIDGCHSYDGVRNDFLKVYPLLSESGTIAFHDTLRIDGTREFVLDLLTELNDKTFDIISLPWGNGKRRCGVSFLTKRTYHKCGLRIDEICGSKRTPSEIYKLEQEVYSQ